MDSNTLASGLGIAGMVAAGGVAVATWRQLKGLLTQLSRYIVCSAKTEHSVSGPIYEYCSEKMKPSPLRKRVYGSAKLFIKQQQQTRNIPYEILINNLLIYRKGWKFLVITQNVDKNGGWTGDLNLYFLRGTWDIDNFVKEAMDFVFHKNQNRDSKRFHINKYYGSRRNGGESPSSAGTETLKEGHGKSITSIKNGCYRLIGYSKSEIEYDEIENMNPLDVYSFPDDILELINEAIKWLKSERWYKARGIPWTRGYLIEGKPGCGKTSLLRSIAQILDIPIAILDLASMSNQDLSTVWASITASAPIMVVIEDIDGVFHGRKNILNNQHSTGLTFDALLNCISGVDRSDGIFLGITTNNIDLIDPAIGRSVDGSQRSSRPGRIDRVIHLGPMNEGCRRKLSYRILSSHPDEAEKLIQMGDGMTAAQFSDMCVSRAMEIYWADSGLVETKIDATEHVSAPVIKRRIKRKKV